MIIEDLHTHTTYSHGKCSPSELAAAAAGLGLRGLAISEHARANMFYGLRQHAFMSLAEEVARLRSEYEDRLDIRLGVELNLLGKGRVDRYEGIDFEVRILGYHRGIFPKTAFACRALAEAFGASGNAERNTDEYIRAIENNRIDIIAHPGEYIRVNIARLATAAAAAGTLLEINNRHVTLSADDLKRAADCGASFIISSDAHAIDELKYENALHVALAAGVPERVVNWQT